MVLVREHPALWDGGAHSFMGPHPHRTAVVLRMKIAKGWQQPGLWMQRKINTL